ncbi:MAG: hypothetical protein IJY71_04220 [Clostridia bacterium]|nr:hypothetical protein [Clostridia bacterium]
MNERELLRAVEEPGDAGRCLCCQGALTGNEIGLTKKLLSRRALRYLCLDCLAEHFRSDRATMEAYVEKFRRAGCLDFQ